MGQSLSTRFTFVVEDSPYKALEIRKTTTGELFIPVASIANLLGMPDCEYLLKECRWKCTTLEREKVISVRDFSKLIGAVSLGRCGSTATKGLLDYLRLHCVDEIIDANERGEFRVKSTKMTKVEPIEEPAEKMELVRVVDYRVGRSDREAVNSRDIYDKLNNGLLYADWVKKAIGGHGLMEHLDYEYDPSDDSYWIAREAVIDILQRDESIEGRRVRVYLISRDTQLRSIEAGGMVGMTEERLSAVMQKQMDYLMNQQDARIERLLDAKFGEFTTKITSALLNHGIQVSPVAIPGLKRDPKAGHVMRNVAYMFNMSHRSDNPDSLPNRLAEMNWIKRDAHRWVGTEFAMQNGYVIRGLQQVRITPKGLDHLTQQLASKVGA